MPAVGAAVITICSIGVASLKHRRLETMVNGGCAAAPGDGAKGGCGGFLRGSGGGMLLSRSACLVIGSGAEFFRHGQAPTAAATSGEPSACPEEAGKHNARNQKSSTTLSSHGPALPSHAPAPPSYAPAPPSYAPAIAHEEDPATPMAPPPPSSLLQTSGGPPRKTTAKCKGRPATVLPAASPPPPSAEHQVFDDMATSCPERDISAQFQRRTLYVPAPRSLPPSPELKCRRSPNLLLLSPNSCRPRRRPSQAPAPRQSPWRSSGSGYRRWPPALRPSADLSASTWNRPPRDPAAAAATRPPKKPPPWLAALPTAAAPSSAPSDPGSAASRSAAPVPRRRAPAARALHDPRSWPTGAKFWRPMPSPLSRTRPRRALASGSGSWSRTAERGKEQRG
ncbi:hypothetical protein BRADI_5g06881v3 [Brachypodium distachyon]|uniref:Uncharacterized protein n=1 Tax=Brachypodium distachyon TaxID=15368 RepID=A0A2K2CFQ2_BRADI|nr:hypothetical protein BRADI_5g06881v3 [Brachypodium distachyon]